MNYNELYVLNSAIDGADIYSIQKFSSKRMTRAAVEVIKDMLIQKGFLQDYSTLTTKGVLEVRRIKQFKEAKKYVRILNMIIGLVDDKKSILLTLEGNGEYNFSTIDSRNNIDALIDVFPNLLVQEVTNNSLNYTDTYVNPRDLLKKYKINVNLSFTIYTEYPKVQEKNTKELFFVSEDKKYYYDCLTNRLYESNSDGIVKQLRERMEVI